MQHSARLDGCSVGFKHFWSGQPIRKNFRIVSTMPRMAAALDRRCNGQHMHHVLEGKDAVYQSGFYTKTICHLIVGVVMDKPQRHD